MESQLQAKRCIYSAAPLILTFNHETPPQLQRVAHPPGVINFWSNTKPVRGDSLKKEF